MALRTDYRKPTSPTSSNPRSTAMAKATAPAPATGPKFQAAPAPAPTHSTGSQSFYGGDSGGGGGDYYGGGGGGSSYGGGGGGAMMAPMVAAPSEEDYLAGDSGFQTQSSALQAALQRFLADSDFQKKTYETDYGKSLKDLGYDEGQKSWNWNDKLTASGRGYQSQLDDFASRNMLQSQGYADAFNELQRMLGQQYESVSGARQTFMTDMDNQTANYRGENTANVQAARAEALARRASQFGL